MMPAVCDVIGDQSLIQHAACKEPNLALGVILGKRWRYTLCLR